MNTIDALIAIAAVLAIFHGARAGFARLLFGLIGFWAGFYVGAIISSEVSALGSNAGQRAVVAMACIGFSLAVFSAVGEIVGRRVSSLVRVVRLGWLDSGLGGVAAGATAVFLAWLLASLFSGLPVLGAMADVRESRILQALDRSLPPPPQVLTDIERAIIPGAFPRAFIGLEPHAEPLPQEVLPEDVQAAVAAARESIVKIEGAGCGGISFGSGFVAAPGLVVTNAHVIAGIGRPIVVDARGRHEATVALFDSSLDIAVLRASGLSGGALAFESADQERGAAAVAMGYPGGGSFSAVSAGVMEQVVARGRDIYGKGVTRRLVYVLQTKVVEGNSGGPVVSPGGKVVGVIFARSESDANVGYAITAAEVEERVARASVAGRAVETGPCLEK